MWGFVSKPPFNKENKWVDGRVLDVFTGHTYRSYIQLINGNNLYVRGYLGMFLLGKSQTWKRISKRSAIRYRQKAIEAWRKHVLANAAYYKKDIRYIQKKWKTKVDITPLNAIKAAKCGQL